MSPATASLALRGHGVVSAGGLGPDALAGVVAGRSVAELFTDPLPRPAEPIWGDFNIREQLGRKGTSTFDRVTGLAVTACGAALADAQSSAAGLDAADQSAAGVALGTTVGSLRSTVEFSQETLVGEKPYLVNPMLFPNTVMNCAAAQVGIRLGLHGVNATLAGGPLGFHQALQFVANALRRGHAETMLAGAAEEFSPHRAWSEPDSTGEGAAAFVFSAAPPGPGEVGLAGVRLGFTGPGTDPADALRDCVTALLDRTPIVSGHAVRVVITTEDPDDRTTEYAPAAAALGHEDAERFAPSERFGRCGSVTTALGLAVYLGDPDRTPGYALLTARSARGGVAAALVGSG